MKEITILAVSFVWNWKSQAQSNLDKNVIVSVYELTFFYI